MVSDQCQALERDNVFGESDNRKLLKVREPGPDDMVPTMLTQGKGVKEVEPEFFIVSLAHGQPQHEKDYNILKIHDFPAKNRDKPATQNEFKGYLKKYKSEKSERKFANFQLLLYIAQLLDIDTAVAIAENVGQERPLDGALVELLTTM